MTTITLPDVSRETKDFLDRQKGEPTGLVQSYRGSSRLVQNPTDGTFAEQDRGYLDHQCFTYDAALSAIAYAIAGDIDAAFRIIRVLEPNFHIAKGDQIGLLNSYRTDSFADGVRLLMMGIDGDRLHSGPNLWVAFAAFHVSRISGDPSGYPLMLEIAKWAMHRLKRQPTADKRRGGISMGSGWGPNWRETYSTEHNLDYLALFRMIESAVGDPAFQKALDTSCLTVEQCRLEQESVSAWMRERVFDATSGSFHVGFNVHGVHRVHALDTTSFAILGLGAATLQRMGVDADRLIKNAETALRVATPAGGGLVKGFDFTDAAGFGGKRERVIWLEGSYQMVVAYQEMARWHREAGTSTRAATYARKARKLADDLGHLVRHVNPDGGVPTYTSIKPGATEIKTTFKDDWEIQRGDQNRPVESVASAVWRLMAAKAFNPMAADPWIPNK